MELLSKKRSLRILFVIGLIACLVWFWYEPKWDQSLAFVSLALGFVATIETKVPALGGIWVYRVTRSGQEFGHAGRCELIQEGSAIKVDGHRYVLSVRKGEVSEQVQGDWHWESYWGQISQDGWFRFDYEINVMDGGETDHVSGLCKVHVAKGARKMSGTYHRLPPFKSERFNAQWGTIHFSKLEGIDCKLDRPEKGYDKDGFEL